MGLQVSVETIQTSLSAESTPVLSLCMFQTLIVLLNASVSVLMHDSPQPTELTCVMNRVQDCCTWTLSVKLLYSLYTHPSAWALHALHFSVLCDNCVYVHIQKHIEKTQDITACMHWFLNPKTGCSTPQNIFSESQNMFWRCRMPV